MLLLSLRKKFVLLLKELNIPHHFIEIRQWPDEDYQFSVDCTKCGLPFLMLYFIKRDEHDGGPTINIRPCDCIDEQTKKRMYWFDEDWRDNEESRRKGVPGRHA